MAKKTVKITSGTLRFAGGTIKLDGGTINIEYDDVVTPPVITPPVVTPPVVTPPVVTPPVVTPPTNLKAAWQAKLPLSTKDTKVLPAPMASGLPTPEKNSNGYVHIYSDMSPESADGRYVLLLELDASKTNAVGYHLYDKTTKTTKPVQLYRPRWYGNTLVGTDPANAIKWLHLEPSTLKVTKTFTAGPAVDANWQDSDHPLYSTWSRVGNDLWGDDQRLCPFPSGTLNWLQLSEKGFFAQIDGNIRYYDYTGAQKWSQPVKDHSGISKSGKGAFCSSRLQQSSTFGGNLPTHARFNADGTVDHIRVMSWNLGHVSANAEFDVTDVDGGHVYMVFPDGEVRYMAKATGSGYWAQIQPSISANGRTVYFRHNGEGYSISI